MSTRRERFNWSDTVIIVRVVGANNRFDIGDELIVDPKAEIKIGDLVLCGDHVFTFNLGTRGVTGKIVKLMGTL